MEETSYKNDYIVTFRVKGDEFHKPYEIQEGYTEEHLKSYEGKTIVDKIKSIYDDWNGESEEKDQRKILKIEKVTREILFPKRRKNKK